MIELLMVVAIIGIVAAVAIPSFEPTVHDQLQSAARLISEDVSYARNLAVAYNSKYLLTFDLTQNRYVLQHSGSNSALNTLPASPSHNPSDPADRQIVRMSDALGPGVTVRLFAVYALSTPAQAAGDVEFGPLGETTRSEETIVWLAAGAGTTERFLSVRVNPVTGICRTGAFQGQRPSLGSPG